MQSKERKLRTINNQLFKSNQFKIPILLMTWQLGVKTFSKRDLSL
jgi:hypothetical protein